MLDDTERSLLEDSAPAVAVAHDVAIAGGVGQRGERLQYLRSWSRTDYLATLPKLPPPSRCRGSGWDEHHSPTLDRGSTGSQAGEDAPGSQQ